MKYARLGKLTNPYLKEMCTNASPAHPLDNDTVPQFLLQYTNIFVSCSQQCLPRSHKPHLAREYTGLLLVLPSSVNTPCAKYFAFRHEALTPPLLFSRAIYISTWLDADSAPLPPRLDLLPHGRRHLRYVDEPASVELKSGLRAFNFQVETCVGVVEGREHMERKGSSVEGGRARRRIDDEAVVGVRVAFREGKFLQRFRWNIGIWNDTTRGDTIGRDF